MHQPSISYLVPPPGYLWHWAADGSAVEWEDGTTVCLWMELHALLNHLAPHGLPPLGSILLVLMAAGKKQTTALVSAREAASRLTGSDAASRTSGSLLGRVENVLASIAALPPDLTTGLPARAHLLRSLFEGVPHGRSPDESREIMERLDTWGLDPIRRKQPRLLGIARLLRDLNAISAITNRINLTELGPLLRTGLDSAGIRPATVPEPTAEPGGTLLPLLQRLELDPDPELCAIAAIARRMVAMFALPRPAGFPQELPVGGISDITNRGPLDRLLPSELAAEDDMLMARLANHEALYFRRDSPPDEPASERLILMDSGIQLWGLPRLYALAAALGLQAAASGAGAGNRTTTIRILRREGPVFQPLKLDSVNDVQSALQDLLPDPHAAPALAALEAGEAGAVRTDYFFISGDHLRGSTLRGPLHALALRIAAAGGRFFQLAISRHGAMELIARTPAGTRSIASGRIDPDAILTKSPDKPDTSARDRLTDYAEVIRHLAYYRESPVPFRFPAEDHPGSSACRVGGKRLSVDTHRRLMVWDEDPALGAGEIAAGLPEAERYHIARFVLEWVVLCSGENPGDRLLAVIITNHNKSRRDVPLVSSLGFPLWFRGLNGAAILGYADHAEACSLTNGARLDGLDLPKGTGPDSVVFDGAHLALATEADGPSAAPPPAGKVRRPDRFPELPGAPVSAGFVASGTLVIRAQGGRWELAMPEFILTPSQKSQLAAVRPFRRVDPGNGTVAQAMPTVYVAEWNEDCRLIFDTRGLLHLVFTDMHGTVELTLLAILKKPLAAWAAHWNPPVTGNPDWLLNPPPQDMLPISRLVPLLQRFAALARASQPPAPTHHGENRETDILPMPAP
ncbi:MAG: hypothetical protein JWL81_1586 [Verrucomicrobiales bacterium]|nr:hypothetical protein [Verrucomicrobiales bacterium]